MLPTGASNKIPENTELVLVPAVDHFHGDDCIKNGVSLTLD